MIKEHLEKLISSLETEKTQQVAVITKQVTQEKIVPFNTDIDTSLAKAVAERTTEFNQQIQVLQEQFAAEKQSMTEAAAKKKQSNAELVIATETAVVSAKYDKIISEIKKQISSLEE